MRFPLRPLVLTAIVGGVLGPLASAPLARGDDGAKAPKAKIAKSKKTTKAVAEAHVPTVNLLEALKAGDIAVEAQGLGDGRMTLSITNQTHRQLRVVLPPGLIASGATGQFGGMGGMGGMGGGMMGGMGGMMGGMGGMMGGMGGGMMGGMGGGMMGGGMGMMGGGMGMMGGGMGGMGGGMLTMPPTFGMMMLARLIMVLVGDRDSWDMTSLSMGMMGGGMGMMGGGMGMMGGGMGGMGMGMRSVPPTGLPHATLNPGQTRHLPTRVVSLSGPAEGGRVNLPQKDEPLQIGDISQLTDNPKVQTALKRLAAVKAPETIAQLVMWHVAAGLSWGDIVQLAKPWANVQELALAKQFVAQLEKAGAKDETADPGMIYWEVIAQDPTERGLADELSKLLKDQVVLGLKVALGVPERPEGPALACRVRLVGSGAKAEAVVTVAPSDGTGKAWAAPVGKFSLPLTKSQNGQLDAAMVADAAAEGVLGRLVRAQLTKGPKVKGKSTFVIKVENASPLILNGLSLAGAGAKDAKPASLAGICLSPRRTLALPATAEIIERLGLKRGIRIVAADLSGL
jgi:hypothetical protein